MAQERQLPNPMETIEAKIAITSKLQRSLIELYLAEFDLNLTQAHILRYLAHHDVSVGGHLNQTEIAARLSLKKAATGVALDLLEARGLLEKKPALADRRAILVKISPEGHHLAPSVENRMQRLDEVITSGVSPSELLIFKSVLSRVRTNLENAHVRSAESELEEPTPNSLTVLARDGVLDASVN